MHAPVFLWELKVVFGKYQQLLQCLSEHANIDSATFGKQKQNDFVTFTNFYHSLKHQLQLKLKILPVSEYNNLVRQSNYHLLRVYYKELMSFHIKRRNERLNEKLELIFQESVDFPQHEKLDLLYGSGDIKEENLFLTKEEIEKFAHSWPSEETYEIKNTEEDYILFDPYDDQDIKPKEIQKTPWYGRVYRFICSFLPILVWLPEYRNHLSDLKNDIVAGITVGVMLIPQAMAYALVGGFPPIYGLYTALTPMLIYSFLGTSRQLSIGPTAVVSLILFSELDHLGIKVDQDPNLYIMYALTLGLLTGITQILLGLLRLGFLVNFLSIPVINGFTSGAAIVIALSQLGNFTGISLPSDNRLHYIIYNFGKVIHAVHFPTLLLGISALLLLYFFEKVYISTNKEIQFKIFNRQFTLPKRWSFKLLPSPLILVFSGIIIMYLVKVIGKYDMTGKKDVFGIKITGNIPPGPPKPLIPLIPDFSFNTIIQLSSVFMTIALVICVEAVSIAKSYAIQKGYNIDPNQELIALGAASAIGSFFRALPASSSISRTAVNANSGAVSPLSSLISGLFVFLVLWVLTPLFYYLPMAVLAALIMYSCSKLVHFDQVLFTFKTKKRDCIALLIAFNGSLFIGIKEGVLIAALVSLILFVLRSTRPRFHILGRRPGTTAYQEVQRWKDCKEIPGILVMRFDSDLWFANVSFFTEQLHRAIRKSPYPVYAVVLDCSGINQVDSTAVSTMTSLKKDLDRQNIQLFIANMKRSMRVVMKRGGLYKVMEKRKHFFEHLHDAVLHAESITRERRMAEMSRHPDKPSSNEDDISDLATSSSHIITVDEVKGENPYLIIN
jgi:SulP family sulfate permease